MSKVKPTQRIYDVIREIKDERYMLPSIQRSFVWEPERISRLMDSLMNDYPIGSFLVWKPPKGSGIRTRKFAVDYKTDARLISEDRAVESSPYLVLDGQQRLQSLYLGFFGSYDGEYLYFRVDSNPCEEENDLRYQFEFMSSAQARADHHWLPLSELIDIPIPKISAFVDKEFRDDPDDARERIKENLAKFIQVFNMEERISVQDVKEELPYNDVLEVFVRVNSGGTVLTKSDLVFSTVVLHIPDMERRFVELVDEMNGGGEYEFDIDFIIKTSFVLFDKGAKYDVDKLKDHKYLKSLKDEFGNLKNALLSTIEFLKNEAKICSKRFLKSDLALIPIADYVYRQSHQQIPDGQAWKLRQYVYMSFFMRFYSYAADAKLDVIHRYITEQEKPRVFPIEGISKYMSDRTTTTYDFTKAMLNDLDLVLNIIQGGVSEIPRKRGWSLERDHIFPQSILEKKGIADQLIGSIGNLRLISKARNILKSDNLPAKDVEFFGSNDLSLKKLFFDTLENMTESNFKRFVEKRENMIFSEVRGFLGNFSV